LNWSFCCENFLPFFFETVLRVESRTDSITEYEFGMTNRYLRKRMHTNLFFLQRISYNIMRDQYIDFMCIRINVTSNGCICKCKQIIYAYPNENALNKESHSGNLFAILLLFVIGVHMWKKRIRSLSGKNSWVW